MAKQALMVIAFDGFRDEEYNEPKKVLEKAGVEVTTASTKIGIAKGKLGMSANVDIVLEKVLVKDYDAVIFIGGPGSYDYFNNPLALNIAREAKELGKVVAGICAAAAILAHADVLRGVKASCFPGVSDILKQNSAEYDPGGLTVDGKIITADGPAHAKQFGQAIVKALS
ncbi:DJ-1/PfpI family protein [Candidatus Margulisiibacteriota bacterium]